MTSYTIWVVQPTSTYSHSLCFTEAAESLQAAFIELGHECAITLLPPIRRENVIIMGGHLLHPSTIEFLKNPIVWQLEQMPDEADMARHTAPLTATYLGILRHAAGPNGGGVWDYSRVNIENLRKIGIEAKLLEVGYSKVLTRIENVAEPDIDVLFVGSLNERRAHILRELQANDAKVVHAFDCYGVKRDALVARAKVALNMHHYEAKLFEVVRVSYMLANRKAVVSEKGLDAALEKPYYGAVVFAEYDGLVGECLGMLKDDVMRKQWESAGFERFKKYRQVDYLRAVLGTNSAKEREPSSMLGVRSV